MDIVIGLGMLLSIILLSVIVYRGAVRIGEMQVETKLFEFLNKDIDEHGATEVHKRITEFMTFKKRLTK